MSQEISTQSINGINFSARGRVLVRGPKSALIWFSGGPYYANMMEGTKYGESSLHIVRNSTSCANAYSTLHRGGRLSMKLLTKDVVKDAIFKEFGVHAHSLNIKLTHVLDGAGDPWFRVIPRGQLQQEEFSRERKRQDKLNALDRRKRQRALPREREFTAVELQHMVDLWSASNDPISVQIAACAAVILQHRNFE